MALESFRTHIHSRKVVLYTDNKGGSKHIESRRCWCLVMYTSCIPWGAEGAMRSASAKASDHNQLVHEIWTAALKYEVALWTERVPSKYNVADLPSRFEWQLMNDIGAQWVTPCFDGSSMEHQWAQSRHLLFSRRHNCTFALVNYSCEFLYIGPRPIMDAKPTGLHVSTFGSLAK